MNDRKAERKAFNAKVEKALALNKTTTDLLRCHGCKLILDVGDLNIDFIKGLYWCDDCNLERNQIMKTDLLKIGIHFIDVDGEIEDRVCTLARSRGFVDVEEDGVDNIDDATRFLNAEGYCPKGYYCDLTGDDIHPQWGVWPIPDHPILDQDNVFRLYPGGPLTDTKCGICRFGEKGLCPACISAGWKILENGNFYRSMGEETIPLGSPICDDPITIKAGSNTGQDCGCLEIGCHFDSARGIYTGEAIQELAVEYGWKKEIVRVNKDPQPIPTKEDYDYHDAQEEAESFLHQFLPSYTYCGTSEQGDWGVWPILDDEELSRFGGEVPDDFTGDAYQVNDHGNVTCGH